MFFRRTFLAIFEKHAAKTFPLVVLLVLAAASTAFAQIPYPPFVLSSHPSGIEGTCEGAPEPCSGAMWQQTTGTYDFLIHTPFHDYYEGMQDGSFELSWPEDWTVLDWEACRDSLISGDPTVSGDALVWQFSDCEVSSAPLLRMTVDCPSPGRFSLDEIDAVYCNGYPAFPFRKYVEVGSYCGVNPLQDPCSDFCTGDRVRRSRIEATVPIGVVWQDTVSVRLPGDCGTIPECGDRGWCSTDLAFDGDWFSLEELGREGEVVTFRIWTDTTVLEEGTYEGALQNAATDICCTATCIDVSLDVSGRVHPVLRKSWGEIKWDNRKR